MARITKSIDIHHLTVEVALERVQDFIRLAPPNTEKVVVIHGYNSGMALKDAIRCRLRSPRILEIAPSLLNPGQTVVWLK